MLPILIAGGGPAGLTAALALRAVGLPCLVFEREDALRPVGAGLTVQINAMRMLGALGVADDVAAAGARLRGGAIRRADGRLLSQLAFDAVADALGAPAVGIHRAALSEVLARRLPPDTLRLGAPVTAVRQDADAVEVTLADGATFRGAALLGCDGIHSRVRAAVWGDRPLRYAGYTCWRGLSEHPTASDALAEHWGAGRRFGLVPIDDRRTYWFAVANAPRDHRPDGPALDVVRARFADFCDPIPAVLAATSPAAVLHHDIVDLAPLDRWTVGRVALLGDAAHATTPNLGQGACLAIEDAVTLAAALRGATDVPAALSAWAASRKPRADRVVATSWQLGRVAQWEHPVAVWLRDTLTAWTPAGVTLRQSWWLWDVEVPKLAG